MISKVPLRRRVLLAFTVLGLLLSALFAAATVWVTEDYEHVLATEILQGQAEDYGLRLANNLPATLPLSQRLSGYRIDDPALPRRYADGPPGIHEDESNSGIHFGIFDTVAGRLVFVIDLSDIETLEQHLNAFLAAMVILGTVMSGWLGWHLAGTALKPVRIFAEQVEALPVEPQNTQLALGTSDDELGRLAKAVDAYQARLVDANAHEQAFFADASHELRTPLAVIQGVTDVLKDDPPSKPGDLARLQRLDRGVRDMRHLLESMLSAARRTPLQPELIPAEDLLREAATLALVGKDEIKLTVTAHGLLNVPRRELQLLVSGLVRRLVQPYAIGGLHLEQHDDQVALQFFPVGTIPAHAHEMGSRADLGTGSALLDRLASRMGTHVEMDSSTRLVIRLGETS